MNFNFKYCHNLFFNNDSIAYLHCLFELNVLAITRVTLYTLMYCYQFKKALIRCLLSLGVTELSKLPCTFLAYIFSLALDHNCINISRFCIFYVFYFIM